MHYSYSIGTVVIWLVLLTLAGRALGRLLPQRQRGHALLYLSPVLGLAVYIILATAVGWVFGEPKALATALTIGVSLWSLRGERQLAKLAKLLGFIAVLGIVVSFGPLASVIRFKAYPVYNDAFTYLVHGQWLQHHPFRVPAADLTKHPAYTQVALYQTLGLRMGASFFLAWVQAASPFSWSLEVYPAVMSICLTAGAAAIAGLASVLAPGKRRIALGWGLAAGTALSGFSYGTIFGFLPQTCGLALSTALLALLANFSPMARTKTELIKSVWPLAVVLTALGFAYSELLPFMGITLCLWFFTMLLLRRRQAGQWLMAGAAFAICTALLLNGELWRIAKALPNQANAVVGWPIPWTVVELLSHSVGLRSGSGDGDAWSVPNPFLGHALLILFLILLSLCSLASLTRSTTRRRFLPVNIFMALILVAFVYFRYKVAAPWPTGVGQSWNQFKLSNWVSPVFLAVIGAGFTLVLRNRILKTIGLLALLLFLANNLYRNYQLAELRVATLLEHTGRKSNPFAVYQRIRKLVDSVAGNSPVFLDLGGAEGKSRQTLAYFLCDHPVLADWTDDDYIYIWLPGGGQSASESDCRWLIHRAVSGPTDPRSFRVSGLELSPAPNFSASLRSVAGGYDIESDESGWWAWTPHQVIIQFYVYTALPAQVRLHFQYVGTNLPRTITVEHKCGAEQKQEAVHLEPGWQNWVSEPFTVTEPNITIRLSSPGAPVPLGGTDPRSAAFLVKNARVEDANYH